MRKVCYKLFLSITAALLLVGCADSLMSEMNRLVDDPKIVEPTVTSFQKELSVKVAWEEDLAADEYIVRRAEDDANPNYSIVYRGTDLGFEDTGLAHEQRYLYTLSKLKANREFGPSDPSLGVGNDAIGDIHEPNNVKESATPLLFELEANLYYYQDLHGNSVQDADWYSVQVQARHKMNIQIDQILPDVGSTNTYLYFQQEGKIRIGFADQQPIEIENTDIVDHTYRFKITPIPSECISAVDLSGGTIIQYKVIIANIEPL